MTIDIHTTELPGVGRASVFRLTNGAGASVELTNYGARWLSCHVPDAAGRLADVVAGCGPLPAYVADDSYRGALVGRVANRIGGAQFTLQGTVYHLDANDGANCNHSGRSGFDRRLWQWQVLPGNQGVRFTICSPHGEGGFPGNVTLQATYQWDDHCRLLLHLHGETDRPTHLNPTCHVYLNLSGQPVDVLQHRLTIAASKLVETDENFIPTGRLVSVEGTPFDFRRPTAIGQHIGEPTDQLRWNRGYNHCFVLAAHSQPAVTVTEPLSRRRLRLATTLPGVLLYTAGFCPQPHRAFCLETQYWPDAPNHPHFPQCLVTPQHPYDHTTSFQFDVEGVRS